MSPEWSQQQARGRSDGCGSFLPVRWTGPWGLFSTFFHSRSAVPLLRSPERVVSTHLLTSGGALGSGSTGPLWHGTLSSGMCLLSKLQYSLANTATSAQHRQTKALDVLCYKVDRMGCANASMLENCGTMSQSSHSGLQAFDPTVTARSLGTMPSPTLKQSSHDMSSPPAIQQNPHESLFPHAV